MTNIKKIFMLGEIGFNPEKGNIYLIPRSSRNKTYGDAAEALAKRISDELDDSNYSIGDKVIVKIEIEPSG